jgi:hypothetical protein
MKKFWLILLSLGLIVAFSTSAFAVDVKVTGEYYAAGLYLNKTNVNDTLVKGAYEELSTAFFYQRLRVGTDFVVSPCLKLVTRFDAMERIWGGQRSEAGTTLATGSAGTRAENENIAVDWVYINYVAPIGKFDVGIMNYGTTGTIFGNGAYPAARIKYHSNPIKNAVVINADYTKVGDKSYSAVNSSASWTDADKDAYAIEGVYSWKDGKAAMKVIYYRYADNRPSNHYNKKYFLFTPWTTFKVGPVAVQAEFNWATGDSKDYDDYSSNADVKLDQMSGWVDATATFAPVYVGATLAYVSGDDPNTTDKEEGGTLTGGYDWNPSLIMFNYYDVGNWVGTVRGYDSSVVTGPMKNAWFFQGRVGVKPTPQTDVMLSVSYAFADKKPTWNGQPGPTFSNGTYGTEIDLVGTYKITNNLSYMLGVGYLFTGDYFKGYDDPSNKIVDDYILVNKLTLTF